MSGQSTLLFLRSSSTGIAKSETLIFLFLRLRSYQKMSTEDGISKANNHPNSAANSSSSASNFDISWTESAANILHQASIYGIAAGYCISASLLSIINKWAVMKFPYPGALTALQYFTSTLGVLLCGCLNVLHHDRLHLITMWKFLPAAIIFYLSLFTNSELLLHANVDTFIVFRSVVPIFVAVGETLFLKQPWPSLSTWLSLTTIFAGSLIYVLTDYQFNLAAYGWAAAYLLSMSVDFVYIKHVVMTIGLDTWGLVLYNNLEALLLFPVELLVMGELKKIKHEIVDESDWYSVGVVLPVGLSCLFGLAISFFGFSCRRAISATGFTVLGIVNKLLTVVINLMIWDKHSTLVGTIGLLICMLGGVLYQQSTSKPKVAEVQAKSEAEDEEQQKLLEMKLEGLLETVKILSPVQFILVYYVRLKQKFSRRPAVWKIKKRMVLETLSVYWKYRKATQRGKCVTSKFPQIGRISQIHRGDPSLSRKSGNPSSTTSSGCSHSLLRRRARSPRLLFFLCSRSPSSDATPANASLNPCSRGSLYSSLGVGWQQRYSAIKQSFGSFGLVSLSLLEDLK